MKKLEYLEAFDSAFVDLYGSRNAAARWAQGKWCNAHMFHGMNVNPKEGAKRFFNGIMRYASNRKTLATLSSKSLIALTILTIATSSLAGWTALDQTDTTARYTYNLVTMPTREGFLQAVNDKLSLLDGNGKSAWVALGGPLHTKNGYEQAFILRAAQ